MTKLDMDHYDSSQDDELVVLRAIILDQRGKWSTATDQVFSDRQSMNSCRCVENWKHVRWILVS